MKEKPIYLRSLNVYNFRHEKENPKVIGLVRYKPENYPERACFKILYESDHKIDYVACSELMEHNWEIV